MDALSGSTGLYTLDDDKLLEWNAVRQPQLTGLVSPVVLVPLSHELAQPLNLEQRAVGCRRVIEHDKGTNAARRPETSAKIGFFTKDHWPLLYRAKAIRPCNVHESLLKKISFIVSDVDWTSEREDDKRQPM